MADAATWVKRVAAWRASGRTAAEYCAGREFATGTLFWWSSRLGSTKSRPARTTVRIARVLRRAPTAGAAAVPEAASSDTLVLEVGGARVLLGAGFDRATLAAALEVLRAPARVQTP